jgi:hypothetical protein
MRHSTGIKDEAKPVTKNSSAMETEVRAITFAGDLTLPVDAQGRIVITAAWGARAIYSPMQKRVPGDGVRGTDDLARIRSPLRERKAARRFRPAAPCQSLFRRVSRTA